MCEGRLWPGIRGLTLHGSAPAMAALTIRTARAMLSRRLASRNCNSLS